MTQVPRSPRPSRGGMKSRHAILSQRAGLAKAAHGPPAMYTQALALTPPCGREAPDQWPG